MNRVFVRLVNGPVPTGQRNIGTGLLSPFKDRHFSNLKTNKCSPIVLVVCVCLCFTGISCVMFLLVDTKTWVLGWLRDDG